VSSFPAFALLNRHLQLVLRINSCWVHHGGFFLPLGFPVGHATLKAVFHASVNLSTDLSSSCGSVMLSGGSMERIFVRTSGDSETDRQGRTKGQYCFYEYIV